VPPGRKPAHGFYVERGTLTLINLAPQHYITAHGITYPIKAAYPDPDGTPIERDAFSFHDTEIFLNLRFPPCPERTTLFGITFRDADGVDFAQPAGGWVMRTGRGYSFYFQAGHEARDFGHPIYQQILINCVRWTP
jgi:type 1 glutamine amidotransferase